MRRAALLFIVAMGAVVGACSLFYQDFPGGSCDKKTDCFVAPGEICDVNAHRCVVPGMADAAPPHPDAAPTIDAPATPDAMPMIDAATTDAR